MHIQRPFLAVVLLASAALFVGGCTGMRQTRFDSPRDATDTLVAALRADDTKRLHRVLGPDADDLIYSGDAVADRKGIEDFLELYDARHRLAQGDNEAYTLIVGDNDWPMPIPIIKDAKSGKWYFDTDTGMDEIINRRVGRNELDAMQVCLAIVDAQREYAAGDLDGNGVHDYADRFVSDPGKKNGLYWETTGNEKLSPMGSLAMLAESEGYELTGSRRNWQPRPFHGYYFRILTRQGRFAPGGERDYRAGGKLTGGFAVVAYPAEYGASGIMTFIVSHHGILYQQDLGEKTEKIAKAMTVFDPDPNWVEVVNVD